MSYPLESSEPGGPQHLLSTTIPDLTGRITQLDDQYYDAGGFGDVFRCQFTSDDGVKQVAVKAFRFSFTVNKHKHDEGNIARMIRRELGIWSRLRHRNVVPFLGIVYGFGRQGNASLVSTWMPHGTLHTFLEAHDSQLVVAHRLQLLLDLANGLQYLHSFPLIHGDLSSSNVLLDHNYNACLTDFGCASLVGELPEGLTYLKMSTVRPGTLRWAAPEHLSLTEGETKHTIKSDIYSFGDMALLVLSGKYPWSEVRVDAAVVVRLSQGHRPDRPLARQIDDRHWALIERCWTSISERPPAGDLVSLLQQFLGAYPPPQPLRDLLGVTMSSGLVNSPNNDSLDKVEPTESPLGTRPENGLHTEDTVSQQKPIRVTDAPLDGTLSPRKWARGRILGKGTYGCVYLALDMSTGEMFAVKQVEKDVRGLDFVHELRMERDILSGLNHPHIIAFLGSEERATFLAIFLEYVPGGTITSCLREHGHFNEEVVKSFTAQIFDGLAYLHANGIIHRNVEASNILVEQTGTCKLSGFGNAQRADDNHASWIPMRGAVLWTAPEMVKGQDRRYGYKVDIWGAGCVLLKMWTGGRPSDGDVFVLMVKAMRQGTPPPPYLDVIPSDLAIDFRSRCFAIDPEARASAAELIQHPYLALTPGWVLTSFT